MSYNKNDKSSRDVPYWMQGPASTGNYFLDLLMMASGFVMLALAFVGLLYGAILVIGGVTALLDGFGHGFGTQLSKHLLMGALTGAFAGIATVAYRAWRKNPSGAEKSFLSALFNGQIEFDAVFWGRVAVGGTVGLLVGLVASATGAVSPLDWLTGQPFHLTSTVLGQVVLGGAGGGWGDFFGNLIFYGAGLIVLGLLLGVTFGFGIQLLLFAAAGAAKGAAKEYIQMILEEAGIREEIQAPKPVASGAVRGAIVGIVVGVLFTLFTAIKSLSSIS